MSVHELKTHPVPFQAVVDHLKKFEVRSTLDRTFKVDDTLVLREYDPATETYTGRVVHAWIPYILQGGQFGLPTNMCVMSLEGIRLVEGEA